MVVYHGTSSDKFKVFKSPESEFWFTDSKAVVKEFGYRREDVYLKMEKPYRVDLAGKAMIEIYDAIDHAKNNGFDGVFATNVNEGSSVPIHSQIIVFSPKQIKSATGNTGAFAGTTADITRSPPRDTTAEQAVKQRALGDLRKRLNVLQSLKKCLA